VPLARISGTVVDAAGRPAPGGVTLTHSRRAGAIAAPVRVAPIRPDGTFAFANVPAGDYVIQSRKAGNDPYTEPEFAALFVTVTGADVAGLAIRLSRGSTVAGHITLDGTSEPPPWSAIDLSARPVDVDRAPAGLNPASARLRDDWTFEMAGLNGPRLFRLEYVPRGWMLSAVRADGVDVTDTPVEFGRADQSVRDLEVVLTDRVTEVRGRILDDRGREVVDGTVIVFAEDRRQWIPASRFIAATRPAQDGQFSIGELPPGEYYAAAVDRILAGEWQDPALLDSLIPFASRVSLSEGATASATLRLVVR
jgi:hypothetical protein